MRQQRETCVRQAGKVGLALWLAALTVMMTGAQAGQQVRGGVSTTDDTDRGGVKRAVGSGGEAKAEPATRIEKFLLRKNVLLTTEHLIIGSVPGQQGAEVRIEALVVSVAGEAAKAYGLVLARAARQASERAGAREATCFVDFDELEALQNALDAIARYADEPRLRGGTELSAPATNDSATNDPAANNRDRQVWTKELSLQTRGGLRVGLAQSGRQLLGFLQIGSPEPEAGIAFGIGAIGRLRLHVAQSRRQLAEMGAR